MKKTMLRSLIVGLFAVVSLNASALYWPFTHWQPNQVSIGTFWMEPNSVAEFDIDVSNLFDPWLPSGDPYSDDLQPYVRNCRLLRVAYYTYTFILKEGDVAYIYSSYGREGYANVLDPYSWQFGDFYFDSGCEVFVGTNSPKNDIIPIGPDNEFHIVVYSGSIAGERSIGSEDAPVLFWNQQYELVGSPIGYFPDRYPFNWYAWF